MVVVVVGAYAASGSLERVRRARAGLPPPNLAAFLARLAFVAAGHDRHACSS